MKTKKRKMLSFNVDKARDILKDKELGPDNAEARHLMDVLHKIVDTSQHSKLDLEAEEEFTNTGVGKDLVSKYSFADVEVGGKEYSVQVRDKNLSDKRLKAGSEKIRSNPTARKALETLGHYQNINQRIH